MANHPKLRVVPSTFLDDIEKLLHTAPPPKAARDKADRATAKRTIRRARNRRVEVLDEQAVCRMAAAKRKHSAARKKAR